MIRDKIVAEQFRIKRKIDEWHLKLSKLQEKCLHPNVKKEHKANNGNYDPSADCYWTEFRCPDCGKFWEVDGSV